MMELNRAVRLMDPLVEHYAHCDKLMQLLKHQKIDLDLPLEIDLRVTVQWDLDQVDLNLHVYEPGMSHCYAFNNTTGHGGVLSKDVANGLGPEEYLLRRAVPGLYRIEVELFSAKSRTVAQPVHALVHVYLHWGSAHQQCYVNLVALQHDKQRVHVADVLF